MRIQLVHPPVFLNVRSLTALRPSPPLGLASIAAALREAGHDVAVLDAVAEGVDHVEPDGRLHRLGLSVDDLIDRLDPHAQFIGIGGMWSFSWPLVRTLVRRIRARLPNALLVGGGEHFTGLAEESLDEAPLDVIVTGEGEETVVELAAAHAAGLPFDGIEGLVFRGAEGVVRTTARSRIRGIDDLPWPAWDLFDLDTYNRHALQAGLRRGYSVPILATRGCPYRCAYCSSPSMWTTKWVARDPVKVVDEIEHYVRTYGARDFPFQDLTAILRRSWILAFCHELIDRNLDITWQLPSGTRCEVVDDEVADLLRRTGGHHLAFAPESGSEETRKLIRKQMDRDKLLAAVRAAVRQKLSLTAFLVLGFPDDTPADLRASARLARRFAWMGMTDLAVGYFFPIPNTELYHRLVAEGRITLNDDFLKTPIYANDPFLRRENHYATHVSPFRLSFTKHWIVAQFYALSFLLRPWRLVRMTVNVLKGRETSKLETFLIELKRKLRIWWSPRPSNHGPLGRVGERGDRSRAPAAADRPPTPTEA